MESRESAFVLGQRYTLATLALGVALLSFLNLAGMEKAIFAIVLGVKALSLAPAPALERRRKWAWTAIGLGAAHVTLLVALVLFNLDRIPKLLEVLRAMSDLR